MLTRPAPVAQRLIEHRTPRAIERQRPRRARLHAHQTRGTACPGNASLLVHQGNTDTIDSRAHSPNRAGRAHLGTPTAKVAHTLMEIHERRAQAQNAVLKQPCADSVRRADAAAPLALEARAEEKTIILSCRRPKRRRIRIGESPRCAAEAKRCSNKDTPLDKRSTRERY